jgi:hypothetical protein
MVIKNGNITKEKMFWFIKKLTGFVNLKKKKKKTSSGRLSSNFLKTF